MNKPFTRFVVQSVGVNDFYVRVADPEGVRSSIEVGAFEAQNTEAAQAILMMQRYLFINDAIQEKLEH
jgi:hypothetical protein